MDFTIKKLGPINEAKLELGDITVLIGPPNVGKSYTLKALYASLIMLDSTARNFLLKQVLLDVFEHNRLISDREIFRILLNLIVLYKKDPNFVRDIIERINVLPDIGDISIRAENGYISATIKRYESVDLKRFKILVKDKINTLWDVVPTTDRTQIIINELSSFQFLSILLEALKEPFTIDWAEYHERLELRVEYHVSSTPQEDLITFEKTMTLYLDEGSPLITKLRKQLIDDIIYRLKKAENVDEMLHILRRFFVIRLLLPVGKFGTILDEHIVEHILECIENIIENTLKDVLGAQSILYIPFGRSPLVCQLEYISREPFFRTEILEDYYMFDILLYSYMSKLSSGRAKLSEGKYDKNIVQLFEPVIQGNLMFDKRSGELKYKHWGFKEIGDGDSVVVPIKWASALAGEVTGILLPILAVPDKSYIIIEEPESQLHYSAQVLMALALIGLSKRFNHRIAFSTHSDIFALTLAYVQEFKPSKDKVLELIKKLLEMQNICVDDSNLEPLAKAVSENTDIDIRFYYYEPTPSGVRVSERNSLDILKDVPGITDVVNILVTWAMSL